MLRIRRLNMDTSWQLDWAGTSIILDPWLVGSEVDGFSWFNEQWHTTPPVAVEHLGSYDGVIVSQSYSDHCHEQTLLLLDDVPLYGTPKAAKRLRKSTTSQLHTLPNFEKGEWQTVGNVRVAYLDPGRKVDPVYYGVVIESNDEFVIYAPHGFEPSPEQTKMLEPYQINLLITSFSLYRLPGFMGGAVNPGIDKARQLVQSLQPKTVVHTHDEQKRARGLVRKIAHIEYPDFDKLKEEFPNTFVYLGEDYRYLTLAETAAPGR